MKKVFSLSIMLAVLATAFTFSSCSKDEEENAPVFSNESVVGKGFIATITCDNDLKSAELIRTTSSGSSTVSGWPVTKFNDLNGEIFGEKGNYTVMITGLADGDYELVVIDKKDKRASTKFKIGGGDDPDENLNFNLTSFEAKVGDVYLYEYNGARAGGFTIANVTTGNKGFKVVFSDGITAEISFDGKSFLTTNGTTKSGAEAAANSGADLLLYLKGETKTIEAGQLATFGGGAENKAGITKFAKQN